MAKKKGNNVERNETQAETGNTEPAATSGDGEPLKLEPQSEKAPKFCVLGRDSSGALDFFECVSTKELRAKLKGVPEDRIIGVWKGKKVPLVYERSLAI